MVLNESEDNEGEIICCINKSPLLDEVRLEFLFGFFGSDTNVFQRDPHGSRELHVLSL